MVEFGNIWIRFRCDLDSVVCVFIPLVSEKHRHGKDMRVGSWQRKNSQISVCGEIIRISSANSCDHLYQRVSKVKIGNDQRESGSTWQT